MFGTRPFSSEGSNVQDISLFDLYGCLEKNKQSWLAKKKSSSISSSSSSDVNHVIETHDEHVLEGPPQKKTKKEAIEEYVKEVYSNDCALAKEYIMNDLKQQKFQSNSSTCHDFDVSLLSQLDENSKFDIIEFIPTFSKWSIYRDDDKHQCHLRKIKYPHLARNEQVNDLNSHEWHLDVPFVTLHKMRLISKRFNARMMRRILQTTELCLFELDEQNLPYVATFLRMQRIFKENHLKLPTDSIYLYQDVNLLVLNNLSTHSFGLSRKILELKSPEQTQSTSSMMTDGGKKSCELENFEKTLRDHGFIFPNDPNFPMPSPVPPPMSVLSYYNNRQNLNNENSSTFPNSLAQFQPPQNNLAEPVLGMNFPRPLNAVAPPDSSSTTSHSTTFPVSPSSDDEEAQYLAQSIYWSSTEGHDSSPPEDIYCTSGSYLNSRHKTPIHEDQSLLTPAFDITSRYIHGRDELKNVVQLQLYSEEEQQEPSTKNINISDSVCSSFIGENTTLKCVLLFTTANREIPSKLFSGLKTLRKLVVWSCNAAMRLWNSSLKEIVMINTGIYGQKYQLTGLEKFTKYKVTTDRDEFPISRSENLEDAASIKQKKIETKNAGHLIEYFQTQLESRVAMKLLEKISQLTRNESGNVTLLLQKAAAQKGVKAAMDFMAYLIKKLQFPCEQLDLFLQLNSSTHALQCIAQFAVYLCNEYQGGRLLTIPNVQKPESILLLLLSYGWNCWAQHDAFIYVMVSFLSEQRQQQFLEHVLKTYYDTMNVDGFYSLILHCHAQNTTSIITTILSYLLLHREEVLTNVLCRRVKCEIKYHSYSQLVAKKESSLSTIPLLALVFHHGRAYGGFLLQRAIKKMSSEQFDSLGVTEQGDNILHLYLGSVQGNYDVSGSLLMTLIRKNVKLLHVENEEKETPLMLIHRVISDSYLKACIANEFLQ